MTPITPLQQAKILYQVAVQLSVKAPCCTVDLARTVYALNREMSKEQCDDAILEALTELYEMDHALFWGDGTITCIHGSAALHEYAQTVLLPLAEPAALPENDVVQALRTMLDHYPSIDHDTKERFLAEVFTYLNEFVEALRDEPPEIPESFRIGMDEIARGETVDMDDILSEDSS